MSRRIAPVPSRCRFLAACVLLSLFVIPGPIAPPAAADEPEALYEAEGKHQTMEPVIVTPGDDDQPTISGRRQGRSIVPASAVPPPDASKPLPLAGPRDLRVRLFVQTFLLRLGVMLR